MPETPLILVVEDNERERKALARVLRLEKYDVLLAGNLNEALEHLARPVDMVISDLNLGAQSGSGLDLLQLWRQKHAHTPFLLVTAFGTVDVAVQAMKWGAVDFLTKPVQPKAFLELVQRCLRPGRDASPSDVIAHVNRELPEGRIVGASPELIQVCDQALKAARADSTVLILGESGAGKELIAQALHYHSPRRAKPLVVVNMAAIPEALVESELFGHVKGSFTSAVHNRTGRFELAHHGTLFIDEIGDFPLPVQAKLLRVLESRRITPVGGDREVSVDVRVVAATSRPLSRLVQDGKFREDLFFRLNVISLQLPPLRQRREDIPLLVEHFLRVFSGPRVLNVSPELMDVLRAFDWPGNIRQLRNCVERMTVLAEGAILRAEDLPPELRGDSGVPASASRMESLKNHAIKEALERFHGNRTQAADFLGISLRTLQRRLREWGAGEASEE